MSTALEDMMMQALRKRAIAQGVNPDLHTRAELVELMWNPPAVTLAGERTHGELWHE